MLEELSWKTRWKKVLDLAWPLIIANSFWVIQVTVDRIFLGQYSTESLAAAIAAVGVFWVPMALVQQTSAYVATFVAQYLGAQRVHRIPTAVWHSLYVGVFGGVLCIPLIWWAPHLFELFGHAENLRTLETVYFQGLCYSVIPTAIVATVSGYFTGIGKSSVIMWINGVGLIANVVLDYLLIFGHWGAPELGIFGAGLATTFANVAAAVFGIGCIFRDRLEGADFLSGWRWDGALMLRFCRFGIPSGMQWALEGLAFTVFLVIVGRMDDGEVALAASSIAVSIMMLAVLPAIGIAQAVSVLVGQALGADDPQKAEWFTWSGLQIAFVYIAAMGLSFLVFPEFYLSWFENRQVPEQWQAVRQMTTFLLMYVALFTCFDSANLVLSFALKGAGDTRFVTSVALTIPWPLMVVPTWFTAERTGAIYWAWGFASLFVIAQALVFLGRFRQGRWRSMRVIEQAHS